MSAIAWVRDTQLGAQVVCSECGPVDYLALENWGRNLRQQAEAECVLHQRSHQQQRRCASQHNAGEVGITEGR